MLSIVSGIPGSLSYIPDTKAQDSRYHKHNFPRIPESTSNKFPGFRIPQATYFPDSRIHKRQNCRILESISNKFPGFRISQATNFPDSGFHKQQISRIPDSGIHKQQISRILESGIRIPYMWRVFLSSQICTRLVPMNHEMHSLSCAFYSTWERKKLLILDLFACQFDACFQSAVLELRRGLIICFYKYTV